MSASERREMILSILCARRFETADNLAESLHVSIRTIYRDVEALSCSYPIETVRGRYGGGIQLAAWFQPSGKKLSLVQEMLLYRLRTALSGDDLVVMNSILVQFGEQAVRQLS